jgi:pyruvate kinase
MRKTKMICGIGPATQDWEVFKKLVNNGMNVVRVNFSHASMEERKIDEELAIRARKELGKDIAILFDTKGPDLRTCVFENDSIDFVSGNTIRIVKEDVLGNKDRISFNFPQVIDNLEVGTMILLNDGFVRLEVISVEKDGVTCKIHDDATLISRRGVNIPGVELNIPFVSEDDDIFWLTSSTLNENIKVGNSYLFQIHKINNQIKKLNEIEMIQNKYKEWK